MDLRGREAPRPRYLPAAGMGSFDRIGVTPSQGPTFRLLHLVAVFVMENGAIISWVTRWQSVSGVKRSEWRTVSAVGDGHEATSLPVGNAPDSEVEIASRLGTIAAMVGLVAFVLRVCFALVPQMTGVGQVAGWVLGVPAMIVGIIALTKPGSHRMATVGIVLGALAAAIGVGVSA